MQYLHNKRFFLLRIKHIIKILPVINAGTSLKTGKSTDCRVEGGLAKFKSINCSCSICGPMRMKSIKYVPHNHTLSEVKYSFEIIF